MILGSLSIDEEEKAVLAMHHSDELSTVDDLMGPESRVSLEARQRPIVYIALSGTRILPSTAEVIYPNASL